MSYNFGSNGSPLTPTTHHEQLSQTPHRRRRRRRDDTVDDDDHMDSFNEKYYCPDTDPYWNPTSIVSATFVMGIIFILLSIVLSVDVTRDTLSDHRSIKDMKTSATSNQQLQLPQQSSTSSSWYTSLLRHHRFMWALTDEEVQERIFERHDDEPPTRSAITPAPVVTIAPQMVSAPTMKLPSAIIVPSGPTPTGIKTPTGATPTSTKAPALVTSPTIPKVPSVGITSAPETTSLTELPTITPTRDGGAKISPVPFGQASPTTSPEGGGSTKTPDTTSGAPTKMPTIALPTLLQSESPVPSMIPAPSISTNGTTINPTTATLPTLVPNLENNTTTEAPTMMNETLPSDEPSLIPIASVPTIPNQNGTSRSPTISMGNETMTETPSLSPNSNLSISVGPTPIESTQRFIERVLLLEADSLKQPNTYRNQAFTSLTETFPNLTPMNNNQIEIIQIYTLNTMYFTLNGTEWKQRTSWTGPNEPCTNPVWYGVTCNADGIITKLDLSSNDLFGTIPPDIQGLSNLGMCAPVMRRTSQSVHLCERLVYV